jgi:hypothetical protein
MRPFAQLATVLSGSQPLLEPSGSSQIATSNSGRQQTPKTPGILRIRSLPTWLPVVRIEVS